MGHQARIPQPEATALLLATSSAIPMRVPLPLATLAPVETGARSVYARQGVADVERSMARQAIVPSRFGTL
jgi:hypothetical protein